MPLTRTRVVVHSGSTHYLLCAFDENGTLRWPTEKYYESSVCCYRGCRMRACNSFLTEGFDFKCRAHNEYSEKRAERMSRSIGFLSASAQDLCAL
jgi:hypothetical protein